SALLSVGAAFRQRMGGTVMNSLLRCCIVAVAVLGAAACASHGYSGYAPAVSGNTSGEFTRDTDYTAAVEQLARRRGVDVRWVNPPVKRASLASVDDNALDR